MENTNERMVVRTFEKFSIQCIKPDGAVSKTRSSLRNENIQKTKRFCLENAVVKDRKNMLTFSKICPWIHLAFSSLAPSHKESNRTTDRKPSEEERPLKATALGQDVVTDTRLERADDALRTPGRVGQVQAASFSNVWVKALIQRGDKRVN
ncbi:uncharacterized protein V6R79_023015 [Siganus canaliculatus]